MKTETQKIISLLKRTFDRGAWHGPSVTEVLTGIDEQNAMKGLPNTHSIIELTAHMTAWRKYVLHRLAGNNSFVVGDDVNFPKRNDWNNVLMELQQSQRDFWKRWKNFRNTNSPNSCLCPSRIIRSILFSMELFTTIHITQDRSC